MSLHFSSAYFHIYGSIEPKDSESDADSESDDSSSSEEDEPQVRPRKECDDDEGEPGLSTESKSYFASQHEVVDSNIPVPEIEEIGAEEGIEILGEIVNIMDQAVIIRGLPSSHTNHVLDSETLLVFDDRKVLGYVRVPCAFHYNFFLILDRFTKLSAPPPSLCIRSNSILHSLWTPTRSD